MWLKAPSLFPYLNICIHFSLHSTFLLNFSIGGKIAEKVDLEASKWDLRAQIGQYGYLEPLTIFFEILFFYQTTQIFIYYIYQFHNIYECFSFLGKYRKILWMAPDIEIAQSGALSLIWRPPYQLFLLFHPR